MAELVAGAFLSSSLQVAVERLASRDVLDFFRVSKLKDGTLLKKLDITLNCLDRVIEDAEERQYRDDRVKRWLDELKDTVFMAEDLLDDIATEASRQRLQLQLHPTTGKLRNFFTSIANQFHKEIESRIKGLVDYLEFLANKRDELGLKEGSAVGSNVRVRGLPTSLMDESHTYGRDADKERMMEILLSRANQLPLEVIAIVGMGGMGKTTLARLVYEDQRIKDQFQHRAWVFISQEFDLVQATKSILQELDCAPKNSADLSLHQLQLEVKDKLKSKKLFLVLDDVWNENRQIWEDFQAPFKHVALGSKILVTTRNRKVVEVMCCADPYDLKPLQEKDCQELFEKHAFNEQRHGNDTEFESIGRGIVSKCGRLPLAIKTLGSLLHTKLSLQDWVKILESEIWHLSENDSNIIPSLRLSYHYLPSNLKRCFAYCSIFPKGYVIDKNFLIQLWMAEGLLHSNCIGKGIEEVGNEIFNDLESRSFFEPSRKGDNYFVMHDLLNDLAKSVMGEFCLRLEGDQAHEISTKARYLSHLPNDYKNVYNFEDIFMCHLLHSFLRLPSDTPCAIKDDMLSGITHLKCVRALSLNEYWSVMKLKNDMNNLKHLRFLDCSNTGIEKLPDSMCSMINLQTLKLKNCKRLRKLPSKFHRLINLRHLDLENSGIKKMPKYMGKLDQLQTMTQFVVRRNKGSELKELGALKCLKGTLMIMFHLKNIIIDPKNVRAANLKEKHLHKLELEFRGRIESREISKEMEELILEALEPNCEVKELRIIYYGGTRFSHWFAGSHLSNLVSLYLGSCSNCVNLPPLGQLPSLQKLLIFELDGIKVIGEEFYGNGSSNVPFRSLSSLKIFQMREWKEWNICYEGDSFPCLEELLICDCPNLTKSLPQHLPSLKKLNIGRCPNLKTSLPKASAMEELCLGSCPEMESLPQGGQLANLQCLRICGCPKVIASRKDLGLHEILSLKELVIGDEFEDVKSFPEERLLPPNLHTLSFRDCYKLERINYRGLLHLHSLSSLSFQDCPCMSFEGMPVDGLPPSLAHLHIDYNCPLLEQRCQRETGPDWPKISHIPQVFFWLD